jgi:putative transposase
VRKRWIFAAGRGSRRRPFKWKPKFGDLEVSKAKRLKALEDENAKLKKLLAEAMLDNAILKEGQSRGSLSLPRLFGVFRVASTQPCLLEILLEIRLRQSLNTKLCHRWRHLVDIGVVERASVRRCISRGDLRRNKVNPAVGVRGYGVIA